jgi:twitching motility protein PilT
MRDGHPNGTKKYHDLLDGLVGTLIKEGASDLHLSQDHHPTIRVSGLLIPILKDHMLTAEDMAGITEVLLSTPNREKFLTEKEIDFSYACQDNVRFRGNGFFQQRKIGFALRLIPHTIPTLGELNLPAILETFIERPQGFFLVVGPVGQGKTTTVASMVDIINERRAEHIITIEDPIEYIFTEKKSLIEQREVGADTSAFHVALRSAFREDVNVLLVGEMRGPETIATAVTAAETGHLVLSTLHTNDAAQTIDRIVDSFEPAQQSQIRAQLSGSLTGIFSMRLLPRVSGGLIPTYELMINTVAVANLIREGRTHELSSVIETGSSSGMIDMNHSLTELVRGGEITPETAFRHSRNPQALEKML